MYGCLISLGGVDQLPFHFWSALAGEREPRPSASVGHWMNCLNTFCWPAVTDFIADDTINFEPTNYARAQAQPPRLHSNPTVEVQQPTLLFLLGSTAEQVRDSRC